MVMLYQQHNDKKEQQTLTESFFVVSYNIAKHSKSFCDEEFVTNYMLDVVDQVSPELRKMFEVSLSRRTVAHCIETIDYAINSPLKRRVPQLEIFFQGSNESTDIDDSAEWLIFLKGISENVETTEEFLSMKDTIPEKKITSVITDGSTSLIGKKLAD
ncbi:hypothetical protein RF11_03410 [Thelohanellus kitauei]|uniref:Uncharacterized protein n=1 Tax=Thelohanellus kitauei TaxID=669202 RepID=A0A0C2NDE0_THEKT|nr:hypothetical protein RF11_03410 [Thelohanellus kitauei]